ncbi:vomeronasal type-2 receptor 26-like [Pelodytes ibericus]
MSLNEFNRPSQDNLRRLFYWINDSQKLYILSPIVPVVAMILLSLPGGAAELPQPSCALKDQSASGFVQDGDYILGVILELFMSITPRYNKFKEQPSSVICYGPSLKYYRHLVAAVYAIEEINQNPSILPNSTLGFRIHDSCSSERRALANTLSILTGRISSVPNYGCNQKGILVGFVGHLLSSLTYVISGVTRIYQFPQISYGAQDPVFSDRQQFPTFYRTITSEKSRYQAIIQLLKMFSWTWVGIVGSMDESNSNACNELKDEIIKNGGCVTPSPDQAKLNHHLRKVHFHTSAGEEVFLNEDGETPGRLDILNWNVYPNGTVVTRKVGTFYSTSLPEKQLSVNTQQIIWRTQNNKIPSSVCSESCLPGYRKVEIKGNPICCYGCLQCSEGQISNSADMENCIHCPEEQWSNEKRDQCILKIIDFLSFEDPLGLALTIVAILFSIVTLLVLGIFIKFQESPIVRANNQELSYILLVSLMLSFLCSLLFVGRPMKLTCLLRQVAFVILFTVSISSVLGKTMTVVIAFNAVKPGSRLRRCVGSRFPRYIVLLYSLGEVIICTVWLLHSPPYPDYDTKSQPSKMTLHCNEGSALAFYFAVGYTAALAFVSFFAAYLARRLPDIYNEAKFITFSMLVFCSVWASFIPTYLSTKGKYLVAVEIFAILASSFGLLSCIFIPKCHIILFRPHLNSRKTMSTPKTKP